MSDRLRDPEALAWKLAAMLRTVCYDCPNDGERDCTRCPVAGLQRRAEALAASITSVRRSMLESENKALMEAVRA